MTSHFVLDEIGKTVPSRYRLDCHQTYEAENCNVRNYPQIRLGKRSPASIVRGEDQVAPHSS